MNKKTNKHMYDHEMIDGCQKRQILGKGSQVDNLSRTKCYDHQKSLPLRESTLKWHCFTTTIQKG